MKPAIWHHPFKIQFWNKFPVHLTHFVSVFKIYIYKKKSNFTHNVKSRKRHQQYGGQSSLSFLNNTQRLIHSVMSLCQNSHRVSGKDLIFVHEMSRKETTLIWYKRITDCFRRGREVNILGDGDCSDIQKRFLSSYSTKESQYKHMFINCPNFHIFSLVCVSVSMSLFLSTKLSVQPNTSIPI
jgi:hypothetical protein